MYQGDIRAQYEHGQTNVDALTRSIGRLRERIAALQRLDGELLRNEGEVSEHDLQPLDIVEDRSMEQRCLDGDFTQAAAIREGITLKTMRPNGGPLFLCARNKRAHWTLTKGTENAVEVSYEAFKCAESLRGE